MVDKVYPLPTLPKVPVVGNVAGLYQYLSALSKALFVYFLSVGTRLNLALPEDGSEAMTAPLVVASYAVAGVPDASLYPRGVIYVSNEAGGAVLAFSDGTDWRRVTDRAVIS